MLEGVFDCSGGFFFVCEYSFFSVLCGVKCGLDYVWKDMVEVLVIVCSDWIVWSGDVMVMY